MPIDNDTIDNNLDNVKDNHDNTNDQSALQNIKNVTSEEPLMHHDTLPIHSRNISSNNQDKKSIDQICVSATASTSSSSPTRFLDRIFHNKRRKQSIFPDEDEDQDEATRLEKKSLKYSYFDLFKYADRISIIWMCVGLFCGLLNGSIAPILNLVIGQFAGLVSDYEKDKTPENREIVYQKFLLRLAYLGALGVGTFIFGFFQSFGWSISAERQTRVIRQKYFESVLKQDMTWFSKNTPGELAPRISGDVNYMHDGMAEKVGFIIQYSTSCVVGLALACYTSWRLTVILLAVFPIPAVALNKMWTKVGLNLEKVQASYSKAGAIASESFRYITTVMINNGQQETETRYKGFLQFVRKVGFKVAKINAIGVGLVTFLFMGVRTPVFYFGGFLILNGNLSLDQAIATFLQISSGVMYLVNVIGYMQAISDAQSSAQKVFQIIERQSKLDVTSDNGEKPEILTGNIEFKNVSFSYPSRPDLMILKEFSLSIPAGKTVAFVGSSGSGKSTLFQLLMRLYDPKYGEVLLDGRNLKELNLRYIRENMSIVSQEPILFDKTVYENVTMGASSLHSLPTENDVMEACQAANAWEFIKNFPEKLQTRVFRGTSLSGGQKQRVAIARAIVRKPRILMLDEATSALDTKSEQKVQAAIDKLAKNQTTLMIAHRLSTIKNADIIVVMDDGRVIESGSHSQLMERNGLYAAMIHSQEIASDSTDSPDSGATADTKSSFAYPFTSNITLNLNASLNRSTASRPKTPRTLERKQTMEQPVSDVSDAVSIEKRKQKFKSRPFPFKRLFEVSRPDLKYSLIGLLGSIFDGSIVPLEAFLMGTNLAVYSNPEKFGNEQGIILYSLLFLPLALLCFFAKALQQYGYGISGSNLTERLRTLAFSRLIRQDMYFFDQENNSVGSLIAALATDADAVKKVGALLVGQMVTMVINGALGLIIAFFFGWQLTLLMLGCSPLLFLGTFIERRVLDGLTGQTRKAYEASGQLATSVLSNIKTVVTLSKERYFVVEYEKSLDEPHKLGIKKAIAQAFGNGLFQALLIAVFLIAFYFCYFLVVNNILPFSNIVIVILLVILTSVSAGALAANARNIADAKAGANAIFDLVDQSSVIDIDSPYGRTADTKEKATVEFKNIYFSFPSRPNIEVLKGISLKIQPGETVALVGSSGSGKSTVASLVQRLYEPTEGQILYCGTNIKDWNIKSYRSLLGVVGQEPALFNMTIEENIRYGYQKADGSEVTHEEVVDAAKAASIHEFIASLPQGYQTKVGEMGSLMSGGQKQRIAIARAIVRKPALLILDEATSALDSETENIVEEALSNLSKSMTTLVIAHRLKTIQHANRIYVLNEGTVLEHGTHDSLIAKRGFYFSMIQQQSLADPNIPENS